MRQNFLKRAFCVTKKTFKEIEKRVPLPVISTTNRLNLKGIPEARATIYPDAEVQECVIHQIRNLIKLLYAGILNTSRKWTMPIHNWNLTLSQLAIHFEGRLDGVRLTQNSERPLYSNTITL